MTGTTDNAVNLRFDQQKPPVVSLKGRSLMVDSPVSGYAYILRKVLALYGLYLENDDYTFQVVGSTVTRYADLVNGTLPNGTAVYATILTYPSTSQTLDVPAAHRPNILANVSDFNAPFSSSAFTATESSLNNTATRYLIRKFTAAMYSAKHYLGPQRNCSITAIAKQLNVSTAVATSAYEAATDSVTGEMSPGVNFRVNRQGLLNVIDVRNSSGFLNTTADFNFADAGVPGRGKLVDYEVLDEALRKVIVYEPEGEC